MKVGFTGTREGMTNRQMDTLNQVLSGILAITEFHHGACIGADEQAASMFLEMYTESNVKSWQTIAHPCDLTGLRSSDAITYSNVSMEYKPPLARNQDIVDACELLIACPKGPQELRSGTWTTIRYARRQNKRIIIIMPDGSYSEEAAI